MAVPPPEELAARVRGLRATARVAEALSDAPGSWLVGGAVRDLLLSLAPIDIDVVVEGDAAAAARKAAGRLGGKLDMHERFGTATVTADDLRLDIVRARREHYPHPGSLPVVEAGSLEADLARRDFTVHAMAIAICGQPGELRQFPGALEDLRSGTLRVMHDRSFLDDPTRLLRLVRYGARLAMSAEAHTEQLARRALDGNALATVSGARIGVELRLLLREPTVLEALARAHRLGVDHALHPTFSIPDSAVVAMALSAMPSGARADLVVLAACAEGFERQALRSWLKELQFTTDESERVMAAASGGHQLAVELHDGRPSQIAATARRRHPEELAFAAAYGARREVEAWETALRHVALEITGDDLLAAGIPQGPQLGRALEAALAAKLDGEAADRDAELRTALSALNGG